MISAVLADDHIVVRTGIKMLLDADPDIEVVAEAAEGTEAYSWWPATNPTCCC